MYLKENLHLLTNYILFSNHKHTSMSDSNSFTFHLARYVCCLCDAVLPSIVSTKCQHCPYMYCNSTKNGL